MVFCLEDEDIAIVVFMQYTEIVISVGGSSKHRASEDTGEVIEDAGYFYSDLLVLILSWISSRAYLVSHDYK